MRSGRSNCRHGAFGCGRSLLAHAHSSSPLSSLLDSRSSRAAYVCTLLLPNYSNHQTLCACSAESARRCAQRGWLVTGTPVRALTPLRFFPSVRRLSACGASRAVFGPGADAAAGADGGRAERARHVCQNAVQHLVRVSMRTTVLCAHSTFAIVGRSHAGRYAAR